MTAETLDLSEFHDELRSVAAGVLAGRGEAPTSWQSVIDSGWLGLDVTDDYDGADATFAEVAVILIEIGRAAAAGPYPGVAVLGLQALQSLAPAAARDSLLRSAVAGDTMPIFVMPGEGPRDSVFRLDRTDNGLGLNGVATFVLDAPSADRLLVPAVDVDGTVVMVNLAPGSLVAAQPVLDAARSFGTVVAENVAVEPDDVWHFAGDPQEALRSLRDRAVTAVACDSLGLSEAMLDATVAFAGSREQFGRKIGSFQAVKHACADMLVNLTVARKLVEAAVRAQTDDADDASVAASMAKSYTCAMAVDAAGKAMQLHGGMGYTWESGIHVYLKRAALNRSLFGSTSVHRAQLAKRYASKDW